MIIELEGITKLYGAHKALDDLTLSVGPGAVGLLGPNGAGKSTLIKALLGLVRLTAGRASVLGLDVRRRSRRIRELVGYMPEDDCAFAGIKGVQAVALAGELGGLPARTALRRAHEILDFVTLGEARYRETQTYSTGMRQKMKLAQALIHSPRLLFLDEPTSGLDPEGREKMLALVRSLAYRKGVGVVVSTHILKDIERCCDAVVILGRGRLLVQDSLANLQRSVDPSCLVRVEGPLEPFLEALAPRCPRLERVGEEEVRVWGGEAPPGPLLFETAARCGVALRRVAPSRNTLEETFLAAVRETAGKGGG